MEVSPSPRRRLRIPLPVESHREDAEQRRFLGYLENVSETGVFVQCACPRPTGTVLSVCLRLPGRPSPLERVPVEVIWTRGYKGRNGPTPGMGLRFVEPSPALLAEVRQFCAESDPPLRPVIDTLEEPPSRHDSVSGN